MNVGVSPKDPWGGNYVEIMKKVGLLKKKFFSMERLVAIVEDMHKNLPTGISIFVRNGRNLITVFPRISKICIMT